MHAHTCLCHAASCYAPGHTNWEEHIPLFQTRGAALLHRVHGVTAQTRFHGLSYVRK